MYSKKNQLMDVVGSEEALVAVNGILKTEKITSESYAKIFNLLNYKLPVESDKLVYVQMDKEWRRSKTKISDAKLFSLLNELCEFVRLFVENAWEESLFSSWMTDKPLKKMEKQMDEMETLSSLQEILNKAAESMVSTNGRIRWDDDNQAEQEDEPDDEDEPEMTD